MEKFGHVVLLESGRYLAVCDSDFVHIPPKLSEVVELEYATVFDDVSAGINFSERVVEEYGEFAILPVKVVASVTIDSTMVRFKTRSDKD